MSCPALFCLQPSLLPFHFSSIFNSSFKKCEKNSSWTFWVLLLMQPNIWSALSLAPSQLWMSRFIGDFLWRIPFIASVSSYSISYLSRNFNTWHFSVLKSMLLCQLIYIIQQFPILLTTSLVFNVTMNFINDHLYLLLNAMYSSTELRQILTFKFML